MICDNKMDKDYWIKFWKKHSKNLEEWDSQSQVLRTLNKKPIEKKNWELTLLHITQNLNIQSSDIILDLVCGNGLISEYLSKKCKSVIAVDISQELINKINIKDHKNIKPIVKDIRKIEFQKNSFSKIIIYAGIQYLNYKETINLFTSLYRWLKFEGIFFIGDIPDLDRLWYFFNNKEREKIFFSSIQNDTPIIGTWFTKKFLLKLAKYIGFNEAKIINQPEYMINSHYRYDMYIKK